MVAKRNWQPSRLMISVTTFWQSTNRNADAQYEICVIQFLVSLLSNTGYQSFRMKSISCCLWWLTPIKSVNFKALTTNMTSMIQLYNTIVQLLNSVFWDYTILIEKRNKAVETKLQINRQSMIFKCFRPPFRDKRVPICLTISLNDNQCSEGFLPLLFGITIQAYMYHCLI